jgi:hypothetical protein
MSETSRHSENTISHSTTQKSVIRNSVKIHFDDKSQTRYPAHYRPSQQDFMSELNAIRKEIKALKAAATLDEKALDNVLSKHDDLLKKRHEMAKLEKDPVRALAAGAINLQEFRNRVSFTPPIPKG